MSLSNCFLISYINTMKKYQFLFIISILVILFSGCSDEDTTKSSAKEIISFQVYDYTAIIDDYRKHIDLVLPGGTYLNEIEPIIKISRKAVISPASGIKQDFSKPVIYTVEAEDGSKQEYTVNITLEKSSLARIQSFSINGVKGNIEDDWTTVNTANSNTIIVKLKGVTDVTKLKPAIEVPQGAIVSPASGSEVNFSRPVTYRVTAENGNTSIYTVGVQYDTYPSGLLYATKIRNTNRTKNITTHYKFDFDYFNRPKTFTKTTSPYYIGESLIDGTIIHIKYGDSGKIAQFILEEKENDAVINTRTLNVSYPDDKTVYVTEQSGSSGTKQDIITLNDRGKVSKFETNSKTESFVYDESDNLIEQTTVNQGYKKIDYDNYNSAFTYFNAPHWTLLYTTGELIGSGANNPLSIQVYNRNGEFIEDESIEYEYKYDPWTRYLRTYTYQAGNEEFKGIVFFSHVFPYSLDLGYDKNQE